MTIKPTLPLAGLLLAILLTACTPPAMRDEAAYDNIQQNMAKASRQRAAHSEAINEALLPPLVLDIPLAGKAAEPRFDLAVNAAPAGQVFLAIVSGTRYSMLLPSELAGTVTLNLKNVTVREALESIRDIYGYEFSVQGTRISIQANTMQTRLFQVSYLATKRGGGSATRVSGGMANTSGTGGSAAAGASSGGSESTSVFTGQATDFWFDLGQAIAVTLNCDFELQRAAATSAGGPGATTIAQALGQRMDKLKCPEGRNLVVNQQSGVVMVRAMPSELREIAHMIKRMQASIERQVMIEAKIIDVELNENFQSGINWQAMDKLGRPRFGVNAQTDQLGVDPVSYGTATSLTGAAGLLSSFAAGGAIGMAFQTATFSSLINFLQTQGNVYVMSSPRIATLNNQKAVLKVGSDDYYITEVTPPSSNNVAGTVTTNPASIKTQPFFSGVSLDVTPQIDESGTITLHVRPAVTEVVDKNKTVDFGGTTKYTLPYASSSVKETDSIVRVRDGMIVAIGGLMSHSQNDTSNKVPGLGDVPVGGNLFKQVAQTRGKREMVILLKPTVIREEADWQQDLEETQERLRDYDPRKFRKNATQTLP